MSYDEYEHYNNNRNGSRNSNPKDEDLSIGDCLLILIGFLMFMGYYVYSQYIPAKEPIEGTYEVSDYVLDETNYLWNPDLLQEGLEYFEEKSNVQIVVMTSSNVSSQDEADDIYNVLFDDAAHALIIIPTEKYNGSKIYYSIGGIATEVIDGSTMDYLIKQVEDYKEGEDWQAALYDVTDKLIVEE